MSVKILNSSQIRAIDKSTIENEPIASIDLMERASSAFAKAFSRNISSKNNLTILAGPGNNGGDAFAIARILKQMGYQVKAYLIRNPESKLSSDCNENMWRWRNSPRMFFREIVNENDLALIDFSDIVIDGLFGSGLNRPLSGLYAKAVQKMNEQNRPIYSIDIPSGLFVEDNTPRQNGEVVCSTKTYSFQFPKLAFLLPENNRYILDFELLNIGLEQRSIDEAETDYKLIELEDIKRLIHTRSRFAHKGNFGHAYLIAGEYGKAGACILASKACLRSGVGLLTVHCPRSIVNILQTVVPEAMVDPDKDELGNTDITHSPERHTIGIGPGIGKSDGTRMLLEKLLKITDKPLVIDADALNILAENSNLLNHIPKDSILTPHPTEFERLVNKKFVTGYDRLQAAREFAKQKKVILILKGAFTAIISSDGKVNFNPTGNPGMATAGSGDCLTGILTSLLAQNYTPKECAFLGVYLHGLAGDLAVKKIKSKESLIATDIITSISEAFHQINEAKTD